MVSYVIEMPREEDGHSRAHKFPFVASEVFNSEADVIFKYFFPEESKPVMQVQLKPKLQTKNEEQKEE